MKYGKNFNSSTVKKLYLYKIRQCKSVSDISDDGPAVPTRKLEEIEIQKLYKDFNKKK